MEHYGKGLINSKTTERASRKKEKLNIVGQRSLSETRLMETGVLVFQVGGFRFVAVR